MTRHKHLDSRAAEIIRGYLLQQKSLCGKRVKRAFYFGGLMGVFSIWFWDQVVFGWIW